MRFRPSGKHDEEVQLCTFDILVEGGDDLRKLPLSMRKANLERLLVRRPEGIFINPFERGEIGPHLFGRTPHERTSRSHKRSMSAFGGPSNKVDKAGREKC